MEIKYYRCKSKNCNNIYNENLKNCPECGEPKAINEDLESIENIFNICD
jgi:RNA polymerase subunit RPABC4/transcription elongation factor Spt4